MKLRHLNTALQLFACVMAWHVLSNCSNTTKPPERIVGVTMVAPRMSSDTNPLIAAKNIGFGWMAIVPYGFVRSDSTKVQYGGIEKRIHWGESVAGIKHSAFWAREQGMKVMLKPQVWCGKTWIGALEFEKESEWLEFEASYREYILLMANIAQSEGIELLCIGTELSKGSIQRTAFWTQLIADIRAVYSGKITYSANWDDWETIPFWKQVDYIGLGSYFPLDESENPDKATLKKAWKPIVKRIGSLADSVQKQVLFTEMGYLAVPGCCGKLWELEPKRDSLPVALECQAKAFEVLLEVFSEQKWWSGGFVWKYYPTHLSRPRHGEKDYDIQGKPAAKTFESFFNANKP